MAEINCPEQPKIPNCDPSCLFGKSIFLLIENDAVFFPEGQFNIGQTVIEGPCLLDPFWVPEEYTEEEWDTLLPKLLECRQQCCDNNCNIDKANCLTNGNFWSDCKRRCVTENTCQESEIWIENGGYRGFVDNRLRTVNVCGCVCIDDYNFIEDTKNCETECESDDDCATGECKVCNLLYKTCDDPSNIDLFIDSVNKLKLKEAYEEAEKKCTDAGYDFYRSNRENFEAEDGGSCGGCACFGNDIYDENLKKCITRNEGSCCGVLINTDLKDPFAGPNEPNFGDRKPREFKCHDNVHINNCCGEFFEGQECDQNLSMGNSIGCCDESTMPEDIKDFLENNIFAIDWVATAFRCSKDNQCYWCLVSKNSYLPAPVFDHQECRCRDCKEDNIINEQTPCIDTISMPNFPRGIRDKDTCECCQANQIWYECNNPENVTIAEKIQAGLESVTGLCRPECFSLDPDDAENVLVGISVWNSDTCKCECESQESCENKFGVGFILSGNCQCTCDREFIQQYCQSKNLPDAVVGCGCDCGDNEELVERLNNCPPEARDTRLCECDCAKARDSFGALKYPLKYGHVYNEYCDSVCPEAAEQGIRPPEVPQCEEGGWFADPAYYYIIGETIFNLPNKIEGLGNCECQYCPLGYRPYLCYSDQTTIVQIGGTETFPINYNAPIVYVSCVEFPCEEPRVITECDHPIYKKSRVCACEPSGDPDKYYREYNPETNECECILVPYSVTRCYDDSRFIWNNNTCQCECKETLVDGQIQSHADACQELMNSSHNHWIKKAIVGNPKPELTPNPYPPPAFILDYETSCECMCDLKDTDCDPGYKVNQQTCECKYEKWVCNDVPLSSCDNPFLSRCTKLLTLSTSEDLNGRTLFDSEDECIDRCCVGACCYRMLFEDTFTQELSFGNSICEDGVPNATACEIISRNYITPNRFLAGEYEFYYGQICDDINCDIDVESSSSSSSSEDELCDILEWKYIVYINNDNALETMIAENIEDFKGINIFAVFKTETMMDSLMHILREGLKDDKRFRDHKSDNASWIPLQCDLSGHTGPAIWLNGQDFNIKPGLNPIYQAKFHYINGVNPRNIMSLITNSHKYWYKDRVQIGEDPDAVSEYICISDMPNSVAIIIDSAYNLLYGNNKLFADSLCNIEDSSSSSSEDLSSSSSSSSSSEDILLQECVYDNGSISQTFYCPEGTQCCQSENAENNSGPPFYHFCAREDVYGIMCRGYENGGSPCIDNSMPYSGANGLISERMGLCVEPWATFIYGATSCEDSPCDDSTQSSDFDPPEGDGSSISLTYSADAGPLRYDCSRIDFGTQTVQIPEHFTLPVLVSISGSCDDTLVINGEIAEGGTESTTFIGNCSIWSGPWEFECNESSFTVAVADLVGVNALYNLNITITQI